MSLSVSSWGWFSTSKALMFWGWTESGITAIIWTAARRIFIKDTAKRKFKI